MSLSAPCAPVALSTKIGYTVSSVELLAVTVTFVAVVAVSALPVTLPVKGPENPVAVAIPVILIPPLVVASFSLPPNYALTPVPNP